MEEQQDVPHSSRVHGTSTAAGETKDQRGRALPKRLPVAHFVGPRPIAFKLSGDFTKGNLVFWFIEVCGDSGSSPVLCDARTVNFLVPSQEAIRAAYECRYSEVLPKGRTAFVVDDALGFGLLRMFISALGPKADQVSVFLDDAEAVEWLCSSACGRDFLEPACGRDNLEPTKPDSELIRRVRCVGQGA